MTLAPISFTASSSPSLCFCLFYLGANVSFFCFFQTRKQLQEMQQHAKSLFIQRILLQDPGFKAKMHVIIQQMQQQKTPQASTSEVSQGDGKPIGPQPTVAQIRQPGSAGQVPLARIVHGNHATTTFLYTILAY